ncbi:MAG: mannose-1-phosphate guanylyltransferase [Trueperaceae bacterium]
MRPFSAVIMAGGKGQRFWPLSTSDKPKQFLDLERSGRTLLQSTFDRLLPLVQNPEAIFIATAQKYLDLIREQLPMIPERNLIVEPEARDSAAAVAYASLTVHRHHPDTIVGFFSSDHRIGNVSTFQSTVQQATLLASSTEGLITIGITPTRPATGYGYIQAAEAVEYGGFHVGKFVEKPNLPKAQRYLESGNYFWNAGIFVWPAKTILEELHRYAPELMGPLQEAFEHDRIPQVFPSLKKISIDYAVMEHSEKVYVIPGNFEWDDIGDWVALERLLQTEEEHNTVVGTHVGLETSNNIIYTENPEDVIVTLGVENLVIVKQGNTILLVHKDRVQDIKKLLEDERLAELTNV